MKTGTLTEQFVNAGIVKIEGNENLVAGLEEPDLKSFEL